MDNWLRDLMVEHGKRWKDVSIIFRSSQGTFLKSINQL